jgi:hypothetical protein
MKETHILLACVLLFSCCVSEENTLTIKESVPEKTEETTSTTTSENFFTSTTHEHDPEKKCSFPEDAFSACEGKGDNAPCEYNSTGAVVAGKCATEPCGKVVCKTA